MNLSDQTLYRELTHQQEEIQSELHKEEFKTADGGFDFEKYDETRARLDNVTAKLVEFALEQICK